MLYAVLDTNVLVSAVLAAEKGKSSPPWEVLEFVFAGNVIQVNENFPDKDDAVFFEVAMGAKEEHDDSYLVTGNMKHFPRNPIVVTPAQFICLLSYNLDHLL